jgi:tRNA(Ile)-lysidine synthase
MDSPAQIEARFQAVWQTLGADPGVCVIAVSGGPDSVALLRMVARVTTKNQVVVAHFDHAWRENSHLDCHFVRSLASDLGAEFASGRRDRGPSRPDEAAGRRARYQFLKAVAEQHGARYLAVGHTANDQVETVLHRLIRGTGLRGLGGMKTFRNLGPAVTIVRPLLQFRRDELIGYLQQLRQPYLDDPSNNDCGYTRNRIRRDLMPRLAHDYNPGISAAILRLSQSARSAQSEIERLASERLAQSNPHIDAGYVCIEVDQWQGASEFLVREMLALAWRQAGWPERAMGHSEWQRLASMVSDARPARAVFPAEVLVTRISNQLILRGPTCRRPATSTLPAT